MKYIVGLDLGTTHTVVAYAPRGVAGEGARVLEIPQLTGPNEERALPLLPSFLYAPLPEEEVADPFEDAPFGVHRVLDYDVFEDGPLNITAYLDAIDPGNVPNLDSNGDGVIDAADRGVAVVDGTMFIDLAIAWYHDLPIGSSVIALDGVSSLPLDVIG